MRTIFHAATKQDWEIAKNKGFYETSSLHREEFIHFSRPHQVLRVVNSIFKNRQDMVLLYVSQDKLNSEIRYEGDATNKFPHLYGRLNLDAVIDVFDFSDTGNGFQLPTDLKMIGDTLIRAAQPGDEAEIANVHTQAWQQSYKGIIPDSYLDSIPLSFRSRLSWWKSVVEGKTKTSVFVAESTIHGIVAFCSIEPGRDDNYKNHGEISAIYSLNEYKGKGVGSALFKRGQSYLKSKGYSKSYLWVLKDNPTVEFYNRMGGKLLSEEKFIDIGKPLIEVAYEWNL
jgi:uncharacterized protein (DUF952 family)/GNAT superfamily N-acetyltransferase